MTLRKRKIITIIIAVLLAAVGFITWLGYQVVQIPANAYAVWWTADLVIDHMEKHAGAWPRNWEELRSTSEQAYKGTASTNRDGTRIAEFRPRASIEELQQRVEIDWKANPKELAKAEFKATRRPFRVIWLRNGKSTHYSGKEPNDMVLEYLKWKERGIAEPDGPTNESQQALPEPNQTSAAANDVLPLRTNFISGDSLTGSELESVIKLANRCGITNVTGVTTERHLSGVSIAVTGDEKIDARRVVFKTLLVRRVGWPGGKLPTAATRSVGEFWVEASTQPREEERTIVRIGDHTFWVGLLNGIKPEGAEKVIGAFLNGTVRYDSDFLAGSISNIDLAQPVWLGISGGRSWIRFGSPRPLTHIIFQLNGDEVTVLDIVTFYE